MAQIQGLLLYLHTRSQFTLETRTAFCPFPGLSQSHLTTVVSGRRGQGFEHRETTSGSGEPSHLPRATWLGRAELAFNVWLPISTGQAVWPHCDLFSPPPSLPLKARGSPCALDRPGFEAGGRLEATPPAWRDHGGGGLRRNPALVCLLDNI